MQQQSNAVRLRKDGSLISVDTLSPEICQLLEQALAYTRVVQLRGQEARQAKAHVRFDPIACYRYVGGHKSELPARMIVPAGFTSKIAKVLRTHGYRPLIKDISPHPKPEVFAPDWSRLPNVQWKWMQKETLQRLFDRQYGQVKCPTGYGKSFLIYCICKLLYRARIAVVTHSVDVLEQLHGELAMRLPDVGLCTGRSKRQGARVTCYSGKSLHHCDKPVDILLVDEVHEWGTDDYLAKLSSEAFRCARRWAFSANVGDRTDQADFELEGTFGPCVTNITYPEAVEHHCVTPIQIHWRDVVMDYDPAEGLAGEAEQERAALWQNPVRNGLIAEDARVFAQDGAQVLIAVETIEHAMHLKKLLPEFALCYSHNGVDEIDLTWYRDIGCITDREPVMTIERRRKMKRLFETGHLKKVIANSVWKRGVDFRKLQILIRADGKSSMISDTQIPGRTSRICDEIGKHVSIVRDYRDQFGKKWRDRAERRASHYKKIGWVQISSGKKRKRTSTTEIQQRLFQ